MLFQKRVVHTKLDNYMFYMILHQELTLIALYTIYLYNMMYIDMGGCVVQVVDNIICNSVIFNLIITN